MFSSALNFSPLSLRQFFLSPKLVVLMMVIPEQYRSINVVKYIVGSTREGKKKWKNNVINLFSYATWKDGGKIFRA